MANTTHTHIWLHVYSRTILPDKPQMANQTHQKQLLASCTDDVTHPIPFPPTPPQQASGNGCCKSAITRLISGMQTREAPAGMCGNLRRLSSNCTSKQHTQGLHMHTHNLLPTLLCKYILHTVNILYIHPTKDRAYINWNASK